MSIDLFYPLLSTSVRVPWLFCIFIVSVIPMPNGECLLLVPFNDIFCSMHFWYSQVRNENQTEFVVLIYTKSLYVNVNFAFFL